MKRNLTAFLVLMSLLIISASGSLLAGADAQKLKVKPIKGRPAKLLHQALYAMDGRLGFLQDVDQNGSEDFVHLVQKGSQLSFRIMSLVDGISHVDVKLGKGYPAGLGAVNLDDDDAMEFVAAYGSRRDRMKKKALTIVVSGIFSAVVAVDTGYAFAFVGGGEGLDLQDVVALDDDGTILWARNLREKGPETGQWDNVRFRMLVPLDQKRNVMIILTNDADDSVLGLSGADGTTVWSTTLPGDEPAAKWSTTGLLVDSGILPVLFRNNNIVILDPRNGEVKLTDSYTSAISSLPSWRTVGEGDSEGFLVYGETRSELDMVSVVTGEIAWGLEMEMVRAVLPLEDGTFMVVWKNGVRILGVDGTVLEDFPAPDKIKTAFEPVFKDINGDGALEFVYISGKKVICWNPVEDRVLWRESLASFVGGANPVALYSNFHDMNGDGWLDVPAATGGGAGRWLSGKTGKVIIEVGAAFAEPLVGDWDGDGLLELFWWNNWHEVQPPRSEKK